MWIFLLIFLCIGFFLVGLSCKAIRSKKDSTLIIFHQGRLCRPGGAPYSLEHEVMDEYGPLYEGDKFWIGVVKED